jgi:hypothetical protein
MPYTKTEGLVRVGDLIIFDEPETGVLTVGGGRSKIKEIVDISEVGQKLSDGESVLYGSNLLDDERMIGKVEANMAYVVISV